MASRKFFVDKETLERLYWGEDKTAAEIAKIYSVSELTINYWLIKFEIPRRSKSEAIRLAIKNGRRTPPITVEIKSELVCRECGAIWTPAGDSIRDKCPFCGKTKDARESASRPPRKDAEERKHKMSEWDKAHRNERDAAQRLLLRKRVFFRICGSTKPKCVRCGCDDFCLLEVNHKNGGGAKELREHYGSTRFYYDVAKGRRSVEDLEILCKPCNAIHYLELKYGPLPMRVVWSGSALETDAPE